MVFSRLCLIFGSFTVTISTTPTDFSNWIQAPYWTSCTEACDQQNKVCVEGNFPSTRDETAELADFFGARDANSSIPVLGVPKTVYEDWARWGGAYCSPAKIYGGPLGHRLLTDRENGRASCDCVPSGFQTAVNGIIPGITLFSSRFCECAPSAEDRLTPSPTTYDMNAVNSPYLYSWGACYFRGLGYKSALYVREKRVDGVWSVVDEEIEYCGELMTSDDGSSAGFITHFWDTSYYMMGFRWTLSLDPQPEQLTCCQRFEGRSCKRVRGYSMGGTSFGNVGPECAGQTKVMVGFTAVTVSSMDVYSSQVELI